MSREPVRRRHSGDLQHQAEHTRPSQQSHIVSYLAVMFAVAFLLLLVAYFQQQRLNAEATDVWKQSVSAVGTIQAMLEENEELRGKVEELEGKLSAKEEELAQANRATQQEQLRTQGVRDQVSAMNCLNQLRYLYNNNRTAAKSYLHELGSQADQIRNLLGEVSAALDPEDLAIYDPQASWDQLVGWLS